MLIDWTVKPTDVLTVLGALFVGFSILYKRGGYDADMHSAVKLLTKDFAEMKDEMKAFNSALRDIAVQRSEINMLLKWYDELRRGMGKIE